MYVLAVQAGAVRAVERARRRSAACTRTTSTCRTSTSSSTRRSTRRGGTATERHEARRRRAVRARRRSLSGLATSPRSTTSTCTSRRGSKLAIVGENGSGKTTLIKLLTRLYEPTAGRITLDGRDLREWDADGAAPPHRRHLPGLRALPAHGRREHRRRRRSRVSRIEARWDEAAERGLAQPFIDDAARTATTRSSASGSRTAASSRCGQWQKIALARSFMRTRRRHPRARRADRRRWTPRPR